MEPHSSHILTPKPNENDDATKHAILKTLFSFQLAQNRHAAFASWLNTHLALL
jgi:hypothetical protein